MFKCRMCGERFLASEKATFCFDCQGTLEARREAAFEVLKKQRLKLSLEFPRGPRT